MFLVVSQPDGVAPRILELDHPPSADALRRRGKLGGQCAGVGDLEPDGGSTGGGETVFEAEAGAAVAGMEDGDRIGDKNCGQADAVLIPGGGRRHVRNRHDYIVQVQWFNHWFPRLSTVLGGISGRAGGSRRRGAWG